SADRPRREPPALHGSRRRDRASGCAALRALHTRRGPALLRPPPAPALAGEQSRASIPAALGRRAEALARPAPPTAPARGGERGPAGEPRRAQPAVRPARGHAARERGRALSSLRT